MEQGGEERGCVDASPQPVPRQLGGVVQGQVRTRGPGGWAEPRGERESEGSGPGESGGATLWQGSTQQISPTSRSCRDMSSSARSVQ